MSDGSIATRRGFLHVRGARPCARLRWRAARRNSPGGAAAAGAYAILGAPITTWPSASSAPGRNGLRWRRPFTFLRSGKVARPGAVPGRALPVDLRLTANIAAGRFWWRPLKTSVRADDVVGPPDDVLPLRAVIETSETLRGERAFYRAALPIRSPDCPSARARRAATPAGRRRRPGARRIATGGIRSLAGGSRRCRRRPSPRQSSPRSRRPECRRAAIRSPRARTARAPAQGWGYSWPPPRVSFAAAIACIRAMNAARCSSDSQAQAASNLRCWSVRRGWRLADAAGRLGCLVGVVRLFIGPPLRRSRTLRAAPDPMSPAPPR